MLGVEAKFVSADANTVTLEVAGEQIQLTKGQQAVDVGGLQVSLDSITDSDDRHPGRPAVTRPAVQVARRGRFRKVAGGN